jgi:hypothetical protein
MIPEEKVEVVADEVLLDACLYAHAQSSVAPLACHESEDRNISFENAESSLLDKPCMYSA